MPEWTTDLVRKTFLEFFQSKGHTIIPSSSLIPHGDPTLLLTTAGMVQVKPYFLGEATPPANRLTSCQKCFRTTDIEAVGNERNLTFFEMLGNFSVGDYFKRGAIEFAWELSTVHYGLPKEKIWVTTHPDDEEARQLWQEVAGMPPGRIVKDPTNWWGPAGETGPCGPDTELYIDRGEHLGCGRDTCQPGCDCERFLEYWNLVFMQYLMNESKELVPLPKQNVDTGEGLERVTMMLQGKLSVYEADGFAPILNAAARLVGTSYGADPKTDYSLRVIADHSRGVAFLVGDGVVPGNEGRGYILRRVLRRAVRHGRLLGLDRPFLREMAGVVIERMQGAYPELRQRRDFILKLIELEENRFQQTLNVGLNVLDEIVQKTKAQGRDAISG